MSTLESGQEAERASPESEVECPRCGYDLRAAVQWTLSCPLEGRCTECGLDFRWGDVFDARIRPPRWCIERTCHWAWLPILAAGTAVVALVPWLFWRRVEMRQTVRPRRLVLFSALALVAALVLSASGDAYAACVEVFGSVFTQYARPGRPTGWSLAFPHLWSRRFGLVMFALGVPISGALVFLALPVSMRRAKVRWQHIMRVAAYGTVPALVALAGAAVYWARYRPWSVDWYLSVTDRWVVASGIAFLAQLAWWHAAVGLYLRMDHARLVAVLVAVIASLGPLGVLAVVWMLA